MRKILEYNKSKHVDLVFTPAGSGNVWSATTA